MWRKILYGSLMIGMFFGFLVWWFWPREWLTTENLAKIKVGMDINEAASWLGKPFDQYQHGIISAPGPGFSRIDIFELKDWSA